jgi:hypothetical protein
MKNLSILIVLGLMIFSIGMVSAVDISENVIVGGNIWNADGGSKIAGAQVIVECNDHEINTTSSSEGEYGVEFNNSQGDICVVGDTVTVTAISGDSSGSNTDTVEDFKLTVNLVIIDVMVPEFGVIIGMLTILSAVGVFFFVRRE